MTEPILKKLSPKMPALGYSPLQPTETITPSPTAPEPSLSYPEKGMETEYG
jgi:hypothetical protein